MTENIEETVREDLPEESPALSENAPTEEPEEAPEETPEEVPAEVSGEAPEETPEEVPAEVSGEAPEETPEDAPEVPEEISALVESLDAEDEEDTSVWTGLESESIASSWGTAPTWPFLVYLFVVAVLASLAIWQFVQVPAGQALYESPLYPVSLVVETGMLVAGGLLILLVWVVSAMRAVPRNWKSTFYSALLKGALVTFSGAVLWWAALIIVDVVRLGRPF